MIDHNMVLMALAFIRWHSFGECRTPGWDGAPPSATEVVAELEAALAAPSQAVVSDMSAMYALKSMDDCARMDLGVAPTGAYSVLHAFIMQHSTTPGLADMSRAELDAFDGDL